MENNKLIAEFMGYEEQDMSFRIPKHILKIEQENDCPNSQDLDCWDVPLKSLQFHKSWDWLMPVVEKIEEDERYNIDILQYGTIISSNTKEQGYLEIVNNVADISFDRKIEHTYKAVVEFIKQYNK